MSKHTPGPWEISGWRIRADNYDSEGSRVPYDSRDPGMPAWDDIADVLLSLHGTRDANAKLIAAAPEMAEACLMLLAGDPDHAAALAREALKKAGLR